MTIVSTTESARRVFIVLSPRTLHYARGALKSLLANALEPMHLQLITDSAADKQLLIDEVSGYDPHPRHKCQIFCKEDLDHHESSLFARYPNLRSLRNGHPCWRKITDPLLLSSPGEEMVVLDPDLYFPNKFCFEKTPESGLLLMWQRPNCLLPANIVDAAIGKGICLAHHVDIGVAHWRANVDLVWLDWLVAQLNLEQYPNARFTMHIEAILWAAIAMRIGGGYLPRKHWHCWRRSQTVRVLRKAGVPGHQLLRLENFSTIKCFHAGGEAKNWMEAATLLGWLDSKGVLDTSGSILPFEELTPRTYQREQTVKSWLRKLGYYSVFQSGALH